MKIGDELIMAVNIFEWVKNNSDLKDSFFHFPNEGRRNFQNAMLLKKSGMTAGVHDILITRTTVQKKKGLWIEIKMAGQKPRKNQKDFGDRMIEDGYEVFYGDDVDSIIAKIKLCYFKNTFFTDGFEIPV